jgi:2-polyprenyl-3-methyl-5-hydroxy-6-metoxy-1,4-benzoquinol methylase
MPHILNFARYLPAFAPGSLALDRARGPHVQLVLDAHGEDRERVTAALARLREHEDITAATLVDQTARALLAELRTRGRERAWVRAGAWVDHVVRSERGEWMDIPDTPAWAKTMEMDLLDRFNRNAMQYDAWAREVARSLDGVRDARLCDLAAGSGGFYRHLAAHPPDGVRLSLRSTDLEPSYVARGAALARRDGLDVAFEPRSATDLDDLAGRVDLFTCTQAAHHLPPGLVVRMFEAAVRVAPRGMLLIDVHRGAGFLLGAAVATFVTAPYFPPMVFDGVQSVRRGFTCAEFELLARLAGVAHVTTRFVRPAHAVVHAHR